MSNREEIPVEIRRMKTSDLVVELAHFGPRVRTYAEIGHYPGPDFVRRKVTDRVAVLAAELDRRVPPSEVGT